jgi:hypothetical protein
MITEDIKQSLSAALALLPDRMDSVQARMMLLAIGLQESRLTHRYQISPGATGGKGPARGLLQFEQGGGVQGVMRHAATKEHAEQICAARGVEWNQLTIWRALEHDDVLAFAFGRLLLWSDPKPLPPLADVWAAWDLYLRTWRPGKPHRSTWAAFHKEARNSVERRAAERLGER